MQLVEITKKNISNFSSVAPHGLVFELELSNQFAIGAVVRDDEIDDDEFLPDDVEVMDGDHAAGLVLYYTNVFDSKLVIKWIYVAERFRKKGIGPYMMEKLIAVAKRLKMKSISISITNYEYNSLLVSFIKKYSFVDTGKFSECYFFNISDIRNIESFSEKTTNKGIVSLKSVESSKLVRFLKDNFVRFHDEFPIDCKDILFNCESDLCDRDINCEYISAAGQVLGCLVVLHEKPNRIMPLFLLNIDRKNPVATLKLLRYALDTAEEKFGPDTEIMIRVITEAGKNLAAALLDKEFMIEYKRFELIF